MSNIIFVKHPLKENDTIESVATELGISADYLQLIHNLNVEVYDKLKRTKGNFPSHLTEVYIHKETFDAFIEKKNEGRPKNNTILEFNPIKNKKIYNVFYNFSDGEEQNNISFQTSVVSIENNSNIKGYIVEIDRTSPILVNNESPQLVIDDLAIETARVIYPLQIIINPRGKFISLNNYEEIVKRWETVKDKIRDSFESQWTEQYISWTETTLQRKEALFVSLKKDWFLSTFFESIYTNYYSNYKINNKLFFHILPDFEDFECSIVQEMNKYSDDESQLTISQTGKIDNETNENNEDLIPINGAFESKYLLDPIDKSIKNVTVNCSLDFITSKKLSIIINEKQKV